MSKAIKREKGENVKRKKAEMRISKVLFNIWYRYRNGCPSKFYRVGREDERM
jgi:hypothetical protein